MSSAGCSVQCNVSGVECQDRSVRFVTLGVDGGERGGDVGCRAWEGRGRE